MANENPPGRPRMARWRWGAHLIILAAYPLGLGALALFSSPTAAEPLLPPDVRKLFWMSRLELGTFAFIFAAAWFWSRAGAGELMLAWRGGFGPVLRGFLYSVALRFAIGLAMMALLLWLYLLGIIGKSSIEEWRPKFEAVIEPGALRDPLYLTVVLTWISFVVAGLREELWRSAMFAGFRGLWPNLALQASGQWLGMLGIAIVFGLGHCAQGPLGVLMTTLLGFGLGAIMLRHRSIWEAVFAHGFFDATTFVFLMWIGKNFP